MDSYEIDEILMKSVVDKEQLIAVMYSALSIMQRYNGNTIDYCVEKAMKDHNLIHPEKDEIEFGVGGVMPTNATLYISYKDIHKEFGIESDSWRTISFVLDSYRKLPNKQACNDFVINTKHYAYPILRHLIDSNTVDDEIDGTDTEPLGISDIQKTALDAIVSSRGITFERLVKEAFAAHGIVKDSLPSRDDLTFGEAALTIKHGSEKYFL